MARVSIKSPLGEEVRVDESDLFAVVTLIEGARAKVFLDVDAFFELEIGKQKDRGDLVTAELVQIIRAKVKALSVPR